MNGKVNNQPITETAIIVKTQVHSDKANPTDTVFCTSGETYDFVTPQIAILPSLGGEHKLLFSQETESAKI